MGGIITMNQLLCIIFVYNRIMKFIRKNKSRRTIKTDALRYLKRNLINCVYLLQTEACCLINLKTGKN